LNVIEVEDVWKRFKIPHERKNTILDAIASTLSLFGGRRSTFEEFWALRNVTFNVAERRSMGIVGENGSGKSTLLRLIAQVMRPDRGRVCVNGRIAPMLELGLGFHPELTVRENVVVFGAIMGLKREILKQRIESIIKFAELKRFEDAPLKTLSSGMQMRLAFSVAVETDADIILVDEALAVGDMEFVKKCLDKFRQFKSEGRTLVLVSHSLELVTEFCEDAIFLSRGEVAAKGNATDVVQQYVRQVESRSGSNPTGAG
jgi:lipopolysaccharide transport system ATP-binding protein